MMMGKGEGARRRGVELASELSHCHSLRPPSFPLLFFQATLSARPDQMDVATIKAQAKEGACCVCVARAWGVGARGGGREHA